MVHGTSYNVITTVNKNEYIRVFAGVGEWYIVQTDSDYVGAVSRKYVRAIYPSSSGSSNSGTGGSSSSGNTSSSTETSNMNSDEKEVFDLINKQRTNNGLAALKNDSEVQRVARIKAQDMVDNNYFSHTSPTYGSPFDMLKSFKISYKTAGENIMILVNTDYITGKTLETIALVKGSTIQSKNIGRDITQSFKTIIGGELKAYTEMMNEARELATDRMIKEAEKLQADAIINVRYTTSSVVQGAAEILVYGTAVKFI